ncbi:hypothetical protein HPB51_018170 [Rhipicephalus microplus]|uniref:Uncharacterized protein n=1 Tax=Rhipicephalus microplus TaxID=6941 RepID=A0A9J6D611_RHIMP|nr:hypothetical protein HPB51_018170 [Rhipicephalus microplus]
MLKELKAETGRLAQGQVDISANVATAQKSFEEGFVAMNTRILKIEAQCDKIDDVKERLILAEEAVKTFEQTSTVMSSRLDVIEDRARRDNLIFHGIPDAKESWIQTEEKIPSLSVAVSSVIIFVVLCGRLALLDSAESPTWVNLRLRSLLVLRR